MLGDTNLGIAIFNNEHLGDHLRLASHRISVANPRFFSEETSFSAQWTRFFLLSLSIGAWG